MVFCEATMLVNLATTIMMNGVCCLHSMEEDERRMKEQEHTLKKHITVEWQRQRLIDQQHLEQMLQKQGVDAATLLAMERRRKLLATKRRASQQSSKKSTDAIVTQSGCSSTDLDSPYSPTEGLQRGGTCRIHYSGEPLTTNDQPIGLDKRTLSIPDFGTGRSSHCLPLFVFNEAISNLNRSEYSSAISSLLDDESDEEDEDFEVINLQ